MRQDRISTILIDVVGPTAQPLPMRQLALRMNAAYLKIDDLRTRHVMKAIRQIQRARLLKKHRGEWLRLTAAFDPPPGRLIGDPSHNG